METPFVVMAGGGTAGHVNPLLATAHELRRRGVRVLVLGTAEGLESDLVPAAGFDMVTIPRAPFPRRPGKSLLTFPSRYLRAVRVASEAIRGASAVVGFGGYVSTPAYRAAKSLHVPIIVHEQNARPGMANKVGAKSARFVGLTFASTPLKAAVGETRVVGLPLREAIGRLAARRSEGGALEARREAAERLGLDPELKTLLVTGGSLGALHVNEVMAQCVGSLPDGVQVIHLTGKGKAESVRKAVAEAGVEDRWQVREYLSTMEDALALADLVVARSGAGTVAELTALGLPAVYVPLPIGNGEQRLNAADHVEVGGALIVDDAQLSEDFVIAQVWPLIDPRDDTQLLEKMARASADLGHVHASRELADVIMQIVEEKR